MKVFVSGYFGSGASALTDLLYEYEEVYTEKERLKNYEHVVFKTPNGMFDLEDKLLKNNNSIRSDEAIKSFRDEMRRLNKYDFDWFASYKSLFGNQFEKIVESFLSQIVEYTFQRKEGSWDWQYEGYKWNFLKLIKDTRRSLLKKRVFFGIGKNIRYRKNTTIELSFVSKEKFYEAGKNFLERYCKLFFGDTYKMAILDQFLPVQQIDRISKYTDEDYRVIVVDRDLRDLYIWNLEVYKTKTIVPLGIADFIEYYKSIYSQVEKVEESKLLKIHFEDLIYRYDETVLKVEKFLGLSAESHIRIQQEFKPTKSINNTQLFLKYPKYEKEVKMLEREMSSYLYDFPYEHTNNTEEIF